MSDPDNRPFYEQVDSIRNLLKAGGSRKLAEQELLNLSLRMRREAHPPESEMVGEARAALGANAIEKHRKERARAFAQWELATKPYEGWGR